jgi:hypothetical protein
MLLLKTQFVQCSFEFADNKSWGALNKKFIQDLRQTFNMDIFFETGTYMGATTLNAVPYFKKVITVELFDELFENNKKTFAVLPNVNAYHGKSPEIIKTVAPTINGKILFWLDAHYSGEGTALSGDNQENPDAITAIRGELRAIKEAGISDCVILIDDFRGFGIEVENQVYLGCWAYPTIQEVQRALLAINPNFELALLGDMLLAYDKTKYNPSLSDTVIACTKTRLFDGYNLTDAELRGYEEIIKNAPAHEKEYIKRLYSIMTGYNDPMFWHDLWYGLVCVGDKEYGEAYVALSKAYGRTGYSGTTRPQNFKQLRFCDHILMLQEDCVTHF